jgi:5'-nucleotidase
MNHYNILLSNDDSAFADGIATAHAHLAAQHTVTVIAPDRNCSGASNALSLMHPLRITQLDNGFYAVNGTPSDCVQLGVNCDFIEKPQVVVSGINHGPNLGDDVIYSGTVAAATEGRHLGLPSIAISLAGYKNQYFATAAKVLTDILQQLDTLPLNAQQILNVNVPNIPYEALQGWEVTRLGRRHKAEQMITDTDPAQRTIYWYGKLGPEQDAGPSTDFHAIANNKVSLTPLSVDMTDHSALTALRQWSQECQK